MQTIGVEMQGPLAGVFVALIGLFLLFAPIGLLARKPSPFKRPRLRADQVPTWTKVFFRGLGLALLALAIALLAPLFGAG